MNDVFNEIVGKIINKKIKTPKGVTIWGTQDGVNVKMDDGNTRFVMLFVVLVFTKYSYAPETYNFNSCMSDDALEELYGKLEKRMVVLRNLS